MAAADYIGITAHTLILLYYLYALKWSANIGKYIADPNMVTDQIRTLAKFKFHFFTIWTFILQIIFLLTAVFDEISKLLHLSLPLRKRLGRTRAFLFNSLVFPCSLLVMTVFWTLWHIDRELIFSRDIDAFYPLWLNHTKHTFIIVPLIVELTLPKKYSFVRFKNAAIVLAFYTVGYQLLYFSIFLRYGVWLYPIYGKLDWPQRILFSLLQLFLCFVYQKIGIAIQDSKKTNLRGKLA